MKRESEQNRLIDCLNTKYDLTITNLISLPIGAEYGQALLLTIAGGEDRLEMYKQFIGMFEPNGVVDIAFKTDSDNLAMGTYL